MTVERPIGRQGPSWGGVAHAASAAGTPGWHAPGAPQLVPCSFGRRLAAFVIDQAIAWGTVFVVLGIAAAIAGIEGDPPAGSRDEQILEGLVLLAFIAPFAYFWIWNSAGYTPGKQMLGLRVVNERGEQPGLARGFARTVASLLVPLSLGLAYVWVMWDASTTLPFARGRRQTWHDKISGTFVVRA